MWGKQTIALLLLASLLAACRPGKTEKGDGGDTIPMKYARNLTLIQHEDFVEAILRNPWDTTKVLNRYEIREPLKRLVVCSTVHCALLQDLGAEGSVAGVCELQYIDLPYVREGVRRGSIKDVGNSTEPNAEMIMDLQADAILASPFENSGGYGAVERTGIPIIECADYMEVSPLARAEWVKFYGRLCGRARQADSLFAAVERSYMRLKALAEEAEDEPTVIVDLPYQGIWYVSGGGGAIGSMYRDAHARYVFADRPESGGIPLSLEAVIEAGEDADYWLITYSSPEDLTFKSLATESTLYKNFAAYRKRNVYGCNARATGFFEETPFHPERLLADLISVLHPRLDVEVDHHYFTQLNEE